MEQAFQDMASTLSLLQQQQQQQQQQMAEMSLQHQQALSQLAQQQQQQQLHAPALNPAPPANLLSAALKNVKLPTYSGEKDGEELETWLFMLQEYFEAAPGSTPEQQLRLAGMQLRGQAATWWRDVSQKSSSPQNWHAFATELKRMFLPINRVTLARDKLAVARQRDRDSLSTYTTYMRRLFLSVPNLTEEDKVDRYVRGLQPYLRKETYLTEPATFEAAVQTAAKHEALRQSFNKPHTGYFGKQQNSGTSSHSGPRPMELGAVNSGQSRQDVRQNQRTDRSKVICYNCNKPGHYKSECPEKIRRGSGNGMWRRQPM